MQAWNTAVLEASQQYLGRDMGHMVQEFVGRLHDEQGTLYIDGARLDVWLSPRALVPNNPFRLQIDRRDLDRLRDLIADLKSRGVALEEPEWDDTWLTIAGTIRSCQETQVCICFERWGDKATYEMWGHSNFDHT